MIVLFDIDGTLLSADRSGYIALEMAIRDVLKSPLGLTGISLDGNTDTNALLQISARDGTPFPDEKLLKEFKCYYSEILKREILNKGHLKPGISEILSRLSLQKNLHLGLVTGNFKEGAFIKLSRFGIQNFFSFGAYGCENPERSQLIGLAIERAKGKGSIETVNPRSVVMIGDTVNDVKACHPWGIRSLGVATGSFSQARLSEAGADLAVKDLSEVDEIIDWLLKIEED
ncbi:MAG: HAD family hydrolase [Candidatus Riflebacteria bacterium]|nr:HAD family hydrolase [Candidatus Riflebacteria bacterium]